MIVLIGGEKGGSGKTTLATNIAAMLVNQNKDLLLIDTDQQQTASYWCAVREEKEVYKRVASVQKFEKSVRTETLQLANKYSEIIIDAGGRDSIELRSALSVCDKAIFPLRPSQFDLWTVGRLNSLVEQAKEFNEKMMAYVVLNQASTNPAVKEIDVAKDLIREFPLLTLLNSIVCERIIYRRAAIEGASVTEYKPYDKNAVHEISNLYQEIYSHVV